MKRWIFGLSLFTTLGASAAVAQERVDVRPDFSQAEAALAIMDAATEGAGVTRRQWATLENSRPYRRLKARETSLGAEFSDDGFRTFLTSPEELSRRVALAYALGRWRTIDIHDAAGRAFDYLPEGARLKSEVYFLIKPKPNSFVWDLSGEPGIFLYLDPGQTAAQTQNTIAHELHHVGFGRHCAAPMPGRDGASLLRRWAGAFGGGLAMMAAAGGPGRHPHADSPPETRAVWDANLERYAEDMRMQDAFFGRVLSGQAGDADQVGEVMRGFYGEQGPWYTVGWRMAQVIEQTLGRQAVIDAFCEPGGVFAAYNRAAELRNADGEALPLWTEAVVKAMADEKDQ